MEKMRREKVEWRGEKSCPIFTGKMRQREKKQISLSL
jgi:hypothetical protein